MYNSIELDTYYHNKYLVQYSLYIEQADTLRYASYYRSTCAWVMHACSGEGFALLCILGCMMWSLGLCSHGNQQAHLFHNMHSTLRHISWIFVLLCVVPNEFCNDIVLLHITCEDAGRMIHSNNIIGMHAVLYWRGLEDIIYTIEGVHFME